MLDRLTYGGASSSGWAPEDSSDGEQPQQQQRAGAPGSSSSSLPQLPFQALGIDFGMQRVGVAVRHSSHNVPLFVLHRKMLAATSSTTSSSSSSIGPQPPEWVQADSRRIAAALLHHALQEGCDACVIGLPVFNTLAGVTGAAAASQATPKAAAGDAALLRAAGDRGLSRAIVAFARVLAAMAQPYQLPVLLVNEQQSSQQARAVMRGAAVYDVTTQQQLQQQLQQQQQAAQPASPPKQQQTGRPRHQGERDAYAAALILSRFYNGLVEAQEMLLPGPGQPGSNSPSRRTPRAVLSAAQLKQAAADLAQMQVLPTEQLRRHQQRQQSLATAAAARGSVVVEEDAAAE
jgi:RNase H-fold protein (predicted Holliday junction resolvase)